MYATTSKTLPHVRSRGLVSVGAPWLDLWTLDVGEAVSPDRLRLWSGVLTEPERARAARFRHPARRVQSIASRALLRHALSERTVGRPEAWCIETDANGRPQLMHAEAQIDFNISHTDGMVVCAVSSGFPVGVDVEHRARAGEMADVADRFVSEDERRIWENKSAKVADLYLVQLWTLKEAWAKALGLGLEVDFTSASFDTDPAGRIVQRDDPAWQFASSILASGHALSLAWRSDEIARPNLCDGTVLMGSAPPVRTGPKCV